MLKFPYGISDFYKIITENYVYVDRTDRIHLIEKTGVQPEIFRSRCRFSNVLHGVNGGSFKVHFVVTKN